MTAQYILALDQGTTSSKAVILDSGARVVTASENFPVAVQSPAAGFVEYEPEEIFQSLVSAGRNAIARAGLQPADIAAVGLANQGETVIAFDRETGQPVGPAISWQDRRTVPIIERWRQAGWSEEIIEKTGLRPDPYFSAAKMRWVLENNHRALELQKTGRLCLATSDTWLIARLTGCRTIVTDFSTASRTMLLNLKSLQWDGDLLDRFEIPPSTMPGLVGNMVPVGVIDRDWFGAEIPLGGLCVDQQAALFGQHCFAEGETKVTYGTGCFMLANIGNHPNRRLDGLLTSVGWHSAAGTAYVFDAGIYTAGAIVDWMIRQLQILREPGEIDQILDLSDDTPELYFIPALSGLAAPYWASEVRGGWYGLGLGHDRRSLVRSAMEAIAFRVRDIFDLMGIAEVKPDRIRVDGGLTRCRFLMQLQSHVLGVPVEVVDLVETTALGAGLMAGLACGFFDSTADFLHHPEPGTVFYPDDNSGMKFDRRYKNWQRIIREVSGWPEKGISDLI